MTVWKARYSQRVTSSFLLLALLTTAIVGGVAFWRAREALKQAAYDRLNSTATLKEQEIIRWLEACEQDFLILTRFPDVSLALQQLLTTPPDATGYGAAETTLRTYLQDIRELKPKFSEIFILDRSNRILLSTNASQEGQYEIANNLTYFEAVIDGADFTPIFYRSHVDGNPAVTYAAPIRDRNGQRQGAILAHLNLQRIDQIVRERTGLGATGETYLVGSLADQTAFISRQSQIAALPAEPHSIGIDRAMQGVSGQDLYKNYAGAPVIGVYRWLRGQDLALLVEMAQTEAFQPARQLAATIVLVGLGSAVILCLGVMQLARQLSQSRRQLEDYSHRLEKTAEKSQAANQAKSEFLANMSHELRTPLNAILGFTQLMASDFTLNRQQQERVKIISRSGEHLLTLINDVLSMSKIEAGRTTLTPKSFDLYKLLLALEAMLRIKAEAKGLQLCVHRHCRVPQYIEADEGKLRQILVNLLGNAVKFTEHGTVTLMVAIAESLPEADRLALQFTVNDTGPGIAADEQPQLFDPFFQTARNQHALQGTGLGLAISYRFVQLMGGELTVTSDLGKGATFNFVIPVTTADSATATETTIVTKLAPGQPECRILVVDDDADGRRLLAEILTGAGFTVQEAIHGEKALHCWLNWRPQLIWMDMRMPVMNGYETTRQIRAMEAAERMAEDMGTRRRGDAGKQEVRERERLNTCAQTSPSLPHSPVPNTHSPLPTALSLPSPTKIIALTASAFEEERAAILACGCDDLVRKPFQLQQIFDKLAQHLGISYRCSEAAKTTAVAPAAADLQAQDLKAMPHPWIDRLHQAAVQVDAEQIHHLISEVPATQHILASQLTHLTQAFDYETLIDLTERLL